MNETISGSRKSWLLRISLLGTAALVLIVGWAFALLQIRSDRTLTIEASSNQLNLEAQTLAEQVEAMIYDGVGAASAGASEIATQDRKHSLTTTEMSAILRRMLTGGEYVHTVFMVNPAMVISASRDTAMPVEERMEWTCDLLQATGNSWIGRPLNTSKGDLNVLIPVAIRVPDFRGQPTWAGALLGVSRLEHTYRSLRGERAAMSLLTTDGILLARVPVTPGTSFVGKDFGNTRASQHYREVSKLGMHTMVAPDFQTGKPRQYAVRELDGYPAGAAASRNLEDVLQEWRERTRSSLIMYGVASILFMMIVLILYVTVQRRFAAIARSEQRFQLAVKGTNDGIWEWEIQQDRVYHSSRYKELLGYSDTDDFAPKTSSYWERLHPDDKHTTELALQRHLLHRDPYDIEFRLRTKTGEYRWFRSRAQALWDEQGNAFRMAGSISDIHDRKQAEYELEKIRRAELHSEQEFAQRLLLAQERERQRLANELHDSVGQNLSLIKNRALLMMQQHDLPATVTRHAASLEQLATEVIGEVRAVAQNLRPLHIDELGLTNVIDSLLAKVSESGALQIDKRLENVDDAIKGEAATHMFRIVQEAINNIIKHASAGSCRVVLERDIHFVRLTIADDGVGFDVQASHGRGLGLASLHERCRMLSATLTLNSVIGSGTTIHVEYPVAEYETTLDERVRA